MTNPCVIGPTLLLATTYVAAGANVTLTNLDGSTPTVYTDPTGTQTIAPANAGGPVTLPTNISQAAGITGVDNAGNVVIYVEGIAEFYVTAAVGNSSVQYRLKSGRLAAADAAIPSQTVTSTQTTSLSISDPAIVPLFQTSFVATGPTMLLTVDFTGESWGMTGLTLQLAMCDQTLGRRPHPKTQQEYFTPPTGISFLNVGVLPPSTLVRDFSSTGNGVGSGNQDTLSKRLRITGLTTGHTYLVDVCGSIVGGADQSAVFAGLQNYQARIAQVGGPTGKVKTYATTPVGTAVVVHAWEAAGPLYAPVIPGSIAVGAASFGCRATPSGSNVLVSTYTSASSSAVLVIDPVRDVITATYQTGAAFVSDFAMAPDNATAWYVQSTGVKQVQAVTIATGAVVRTITTTGTPYRAVVSADGTRIYVSTYSSGGAAQIEVYNASTGASIGTVAIPAQGGTNPTVAAAIALSPDGSTLWTVDNGTGTLNQISTSSLAVTRSMATPLGTSMSAADLCIFPGDTPRTLLLATTAKTSSGSYCHFQIDLTDWTLYTQFTTLTSGGALAGMVLGARGEIFDLDFTHGTVGYFLAGRASTDTTSAYVYLHVGDGITVTTASAA